MKIPYLKLSENKQRHINKDMKKIRTITFKLFTKQNI